jgi:hypothetical protein
MARASTDGGGAFEGIGVGASYRETYEARCVKWAIELVCGFVWGRGGRRTHQCRSGRLYNTRCNFFGIYNVDRWNEGINTQESDNYL